MSGANLVKMKQLERVYLQDSQRDISEGIQHERSLSSSRGRTNKPKISKAALGGGRGKSNSEADR